MKSKNIIKQSLSVFIQEYKFARVNPKIDAPISYALSMASEFAKILENWKPNK